MVILKDFKFSFNVAIFWVNLFAILRVVKLKEKTIIKKKNISFNI